MLADNWDVVREIERSRRNIASGGPRDFWIKRLNHWAEALESSVVVLRAEAKRIADDDRSERALSGIDTSIMRDEALDKGE